MPKCDALSWNIVMGSTKVTAAMSFADFEQSQRFVALLTQFIQTERRPPQILEDIAWYCPPTDTGSAT